MLAQKLMGSAGGASDKLYVDDVFSTYLYTGNGSTQTINNGIDLAGKGGLVWTKYRNSVGNNALIDTVRGGDRVHYTNSPNGQGSAPAMTFTGTGYNTCPFNWGDMNGNGGHYVSHTFRRAPKFFDVVTYIGDGSAGRQIPHSLGIAPGMAIVKCVSTSGDWLVQARMTSNSSTYLKLNSSGSASSIWNGETLNLGTPTVFNVGSGGTTDTNINGGTYVAYLFAHDTSTDGIIQCGSFTTDGSGNATVNLGWEPQWVMVKKVSAGDEGNAGFWWMQDSMRGYPVRPMVSPYLHANTAAAEYPGTGGLLTFPTATGFVFNQSYSGFLNSNFSYLAIRRPNKPPTTGTEVYNAIARKGTSAAATVTGAGFAPDLLHVQHRNGVGGQNGGFFDRLRGANKSIATSSVSNEFSETDTVNAFINDGATLGADSSGLVFPNNVNLTYVNHFFKRAPGFMDVVCYTGTGVARTVPHNLGAVPELIIVKGRSAATQWVVYSSALGATKYLTLNSTAAEDIFSGFWGNVTPTSSVFTVGTGGAVNQNSQTHVAYLFATKVGISKVGNYTGNGSTQTIACGFTTGARFVLIKKTSGTGDWLVADTTRGLVSGGDPRLSLNTTATEVTGEDWIDPAASGFIINQTAADANANGATYAFFAVA